MSDQVPPDAYPEANRERGDAVLLRREQDRRTADLADLPDFMDHGEELLTWEDGVELSGDLEFYE